MYDLIKSTEDDKFEEYRIRRLTASGHSDDDPALSAKKSLSVKMKQDEELLRKKVRVGLFLGTV
jgi:cell division control protein 12